MSRSARSASSLPALAFRSSSICFRITSMLFTMSAAAVMASRMRICIAVDSVRSAALAVIDGSFRTSSDRLKIWPLIRMRTLYFPGVTIGPVTCAPSMPQWTTGRVSLPLNRGSSQMCGLSGGVVRNATWWGGS